MGFSLGDGYICCDFFCHVFPLGASFFFARARVCIPLDLSETAEEAKKNVDRNVKVFATVRQHLTEDEILFREPNRVF